MASKRVATAEWILGLVLLGLCACRRPGAPPEPPPIEMKPPQAGQPVAGALPATAGGPSDAPR